MNNFFSGLKKAIDSVNELKKQVENIEKRQDDKYELPTQKLTQEEIKDYSIDSLTNRLSEKEEFLLHGFKVTYNKTTNNIVFKPEENYNYGAAEIHFALFYNKLIPDMETLNTISFETYEIVSNIVFQDWEYDPQNNSQIMHSKMSYLGINNPKVETIKENNLEYHIVGESNKIYVEKHLYKKDIDESTQAYLDISLTIYKEHITEEDRRFLLNEYHNIIDTLEWR